VHWFQDMNCSSGLLFYCLENVLKFNYCLNTSRDLPS